MLFTDRMAVIELNNFSLRPSGKCLGLRSAFFRLHEGDVCSVISGLPDDAHLFLRALATLESPSGGEYLFRGERLDFSSYANLLPYKKRISYISPDSVLIGNRTLRQNLLLGRIYFENRTDLELDERTADLCRLFEIGDKLDMRPAQLDMEDVRLAVIIRELTKSPDFIILERPRDHLGYRRFGTFLEALKNFLDSRIPAVLLSSDEGFSREFSNREIIIRDGTLAGPGQERSGRL